MNRIRVLIADDYAKGRRGLVVALSTYDHIHVVGEAADGTEVLQLCPLIKPHVVLMDLMMPRLDGLQTTHLLHTQYPHLKIIAMAGLYDTACQAMVLAAGASYALPKITPIAELVQYLTLAVQA